MNNRFKRLEVLYIILENIEMSTLHKAFITDDMLIDQQ